METQMENNQIFCDKYFGNREKVVRIRIGKQLDQIEKTFDQLNSPVMARLMNAQLNDPLTINELLSFEPKRRQEVLSAILYDDALWRLQAARIMLCIGMLNVCYSNLRSCLDDVVGAHIIENLDEQAVSFLKTGEINPTKIGSLIPEKYNDYIKAIKDAMGKWGVHCSLDSAQLGIAFGPSTFDKMLSNTKVPREEALSEDFEIAAKVCLKAMNDVFLMFMFLISKGTK
ncbi:MAG TPA: hypothetical protein DCX22_00600 [Dehalococcoidia bacterium]|nr:hypothetical protein [Dehalococcoidia bacterium]